MSNTKTDIRKNGINEGDSNINKRKKGLITWVKAHAKELIIAGVSLATIIAIILEIKNKDVLLDLWSTLKESAMKLSVPVRNMPDVVPDSPTVSTIEVDKIPVIEATEGGRTLQYSFDVSRHIRNLHPGWKASPEKISEAEMLGITLLPGQTLVDGYTKGRLSA